MKDLFGNDDLEGMYQFEIQRPLSEKIEIAIARIKEYEPIALSICENGFYVAFSGGKDSVVLKRLFELSSTKCEYWYNNTTIDPPELIYFIKKNHPEVKWNNPQKHLISKMVEKSNGPPTRLARWCCEIYKEQGGSDKFVATGVRAPESPRRKKTWSLLSSHRKTGLPILCPLIYWTDADIWQFIKEFNVPYCSLYDEVDENGKKLFTRLGCIACPMSGYGGQVRDFKRWPAYEKLWRKGLTDYFVKWKGVPRNDGKPRWIEKFDNVDEFWSWWEDDKNKKPSNNCQSFLW